MGLLTGLQQLRLRDEFQGVYPTPSDFDGILLAFNKSLAAIAPMNSAYPAGLLAVIKHADDNAWLFDLIAGVRLDRPAAAPALQAFESEIRAFAPPSAANPFQVCVLSGGHVMVNRANLRAALKELCTTHGRRILVVRDGPALMARAQQGLKTGKSHTSQLISYLEQMRGGFRFLRIDLDTISRTIETGRPMQPYHIGKSLTALLGCKDLLEDPPKDAQWARWTLDFCDAFEKVAKNAGAIWLVIDSFHRALLPQETVGLLKELATRINTTLPEFRMVLLGYPDALHPAIPVAEDVLDMVGVDALIDFFHSAYKERDIIFDDAKIAASVGAVLQDLDPAQPDFLARVGSLAIAELNKP